MATEKPRFPITVEPDINEIIENYRHEHRISSKSKAAVELINKGISALVGEDGKRKAPPAEEMVEEAIFTLLKHGLGRIPSEEETGRFVTALPILIKGIED